MMLLVGDNPFHGISHLSQERSRSRGDMINSAEYAAELVKLSLENGAEGFMFSVSEKTLAILKSLRQKGEIGSPGLYAIVPYAYEYVRMATQIGLSGLAEKVAKQMLSTVNVKATAIGIKGFLLSDPAALLKAYSLYEISRVRSAGGEQARLDSVMLHEVITEMALALNLDWLFRSYVDFMSGLKIRPGFETRNFAYLVNKLREWDIDSNDVVIAAPFNKMGFQMNPSKTECEKVLANASTPNVIAMSVLAAGYLKPPEAIEYIRTLPNLKGIVVGVSNENQARQTFKLLA
jgi:hypothetical protein